MQAWDKLYGIVTGLEKEKKNSFQGRRRVKKFKIWSLHEVFEHAIQSQGKARAFYFMAVVGFNDDCC